MTKRNARLIAATILSSLALTACAGERPVLVLPPADLATCKPEPTAPALADQLPETQRDRDETTLNYILALRAAGGDCRAKVKGLNAWIEEAKR